MEKKTHIIALFALTIAACTLITSCDNKNNKPISSDTSLRKNSIKGVSSDLAQQSLPNQLPKFEDTITQKRKRSCTICEIAMRG